MKKLLIVESPAKIKTISKFLGKDYKIMSTVGHIKDLPPKKIGVTITPKSIDIDYAVIEDKDKIIADICKEAATANEIYLAPDPDREGEIIAWHIEQEINKVVKDKSKIHRISFNEITKDAILDAVTKGHKVDLKKVAAQQARRVLDRWVGYEVSPVLWKKLAPGLSAGRVQSVALRLIADREEAIRSFRPEEYWSITGDFAHKKETFQAELTHIGKDKAEINNEKKANDIVAKLKKLTYIIDSITDKQRTKNPLPPFMTSSLQQAAFNQLGFSVKKTMQIAQKLYEGIPLDDKTTPVALITYMRTDSLRISDTALKQVRSYVSNNFSKEYVPSKANSYSKKTQAATQDAHEAIRPVDVNITPQQVSRHLTTKDNKDAARLYELIWRRFVACQMTPALYAQRQVVIKGDVYTFKVTGSTLIFDGFLKVYNAELDEKEEKVVIPKGLEAKAEVALQKIDPKQHFTQPPPRFSEASLVKELEKEGIGRPSTYATILNTIQQRAYTTLDTKKRFTPTELGMAVTKMLTANLPDIMDLKFTAGMEEDLDKVAHGELERDKLLRDFYKNFSKEVEKFKGIEGHKRIAEPTDITCPECKKHKLAIRFGKTGEFVGCLGYPECSFTSNFKRNEQGVLELVKAEAPKELDMNCPLCGKKLRQVVGKFGPFIACSGYPECKYIHQNKASFKCPQCGEGDVVQRSWKGGKFWGCNKYPNCKFAVFGEIVETPCPQCKLPFLVKKVNKAGDVTLL
ncbi:MAG: type I DNA topoisomerase, partial [Candidatus Babeliales bacterium]